MTALYPLKFKAIYKDKIWGGQNIKNLLKKDVGNIPNCGEMWLISGIQGDETLVENGFLAGNTINELCEVYMQDILGDKVFTKYGEIFPLLIKILDSNDYLSVQVHPDDALAKKRHNQDFGKSEMWYIMHAEKDAELISGFSKDSNKEELLEKLEKKELTDILNIEKVKAEELYYLPAGRVHALGPGVMLAEIQQSSDITYRIYDWDRLGVDGLPRELHLEQAMEAIDFSAHDNYKTHYHAELNKTSKMLETPNFTSNILVFNQILEKNYREIDSFIVYLCLESAVEVHYEKGKEVVKQGEAILIPASLEKVFFIPLLQAKMLEIYI